MGESAGTPVIDPLAPPGAGEAVLPLPRAMSGRDWVRRGAVWLLVAAGFLLTLRLDVPLMRGRYLFFGEEPRGWVKQVLVGLRDFGQVLPIVVALLIVFRLDRRRWFIVAGVLLAEALGSAGYNAGKYAVARYRPYAAVGEVRGRLASQGQEDSVAAALAAMEPWESWLGWKRSLRVSDGRAALWEEHTRSFPSGHSASAFAFAGVMAWFYPKLRRIFWVLAGGCAFSRYADGVHWPSDCWAGAMIGYAGAWVALRPYVWVLPVIYTRRLTNRRRRAARRTVQGR